MTQTTTSAPGIEKKGGYSGGRPAAQVSPPPKQPSATIRPAQPASSSTTRSNSSRN